MSVVVANTPDTANQIQNANVFWRPRSTGAPLGPKVDERGGMWLLMGLVHLCCGHGRPGACCKTQSCSVPADEFPLRLVSASCC